MDGGDGSRPGRGKIVNLSLEGSGAESSVGMVFFPPLFFSPRLENLHCFIDCFSAGVEGFLVFVVNLV
jgi:hypothetical protein